MTKADGKLKHTTDAIVEHTYSIQKTFLGVLQMISSEQEPSSYKEMTDAWREHKYSASKALESYKDQQNKSSNIDILIKELEDWITKNPDPVDGAFYHGMKSGYQSILHKLKKLQNNF